MNEYFSFSAAGQIFALNEHLPFLCELREETENELHIFVCASEVVDDNAKGFSDNANLNALLEGCKPIHPNKNQIFEIVFENYIIYQVRNESYCSFDPTEVRNGKFLIIFERSKLLEYLSTATDACQLDDGSFYPDKWIHYGVYTQNHIIDIISQEEPKVYRKS